MEIKTHLIKTPDIFFPRGFACGYVGVSEDHPWYKNNNIDITIHGGLTWEAEHHPNGKPDGLWWVGFDTAHLDDNKQTCDKAYCEAQLASLKKQAEEAAINK